MEVFAEYCADTTRTLYAAPQNLKELVGLSTAETVDREEVFMDSSE